MDHDAEVYQHTNGHANDELTEEETLRQKLERKAFRAQKRKERELRRHERERKPNAEGVIDSKGEESIALEPKAENTRADETPEEKQQRIKEKLERKAYRARKRKEREERRTLRASRETVETYQREINSEMAEKSQESINIKEYEFSETVGESTVQASSSVTFGGKRPSTYSQIAHEKQMESNKNALVVEKPEVRKPKIFEKNNFQQGENSSGVRVPSNVDEENKEHDEELSKEKLRDSMKMERSAGAVSFTQEEKKEYCKTLPQTDPTMASPVGMTHSNNNESKDSGYHHKTKEKDAKRALRKKAELEAAAKLEEFLSEAEATARQSAADAKELRKENSTLMEKLKKYENIIATQRKDIQEYDAKMNEAAKLYEEKFNMLRQEVSRLQKTEQIQERSKESTELDSFRKKALQLQKENVDLRAELKTLKSELEKGNNASTFEEKKVETHDKNKEIDSRDVSLMPNSPSAEKRPQSKSDKSRNVKEGNVLNRSSKENGDVSDAHPEGGAEVPLNKERSKRVGELSTNVSKGKIKHKGIHPKKDDTARIPQGQRKSSQSAGNLTRTESTRETQPKRRSSVSSFRKGGLRDSSRPRKGSAAEHISLRQRDTKRRMSKFESNDSSDVESVDSESISVRGKRSKSKHGKKKRKRKNKSRPSILIGVFLLFLLILLIVSLGEG